MSGHDCLIAASAEGNDVHDVNYGKWMMHMDLFGGGDRGKYL